jgi:cysteine synthase
MPKFESILETVGRTPVVRIHELAPPNVALYVKLEAKNPLGSVKDRLALGIIEDAERRGVLKPGQTVIEATSGNTGIGLAMVCACKGYPLVVVMAENFSVERRKMMRFLGAKVILTPAAKKGTGMLQKAVELAEAHGWFLCRQFENEANAEIHSRTTAQEILEDFRGERLDYWVTGAGTGGTLKGVGRVLREQRPETKIILCEPDNSPMLASGIPQPREPDGSVTVSHPLFRPHLVQGWTPDFIPKLTEDALGAKLVDRVVAVNSGEAMRLARELARREGIFTGTSGGAAFAGALQACASAEAGSTILCMLPDTAERYLSTPLFDGISAEMTPDEIDISNSTPACRFDAAPAPTPSPGSATAAIGGPSTGSATAAIGGPSTGSATAAIGGPSTGSATAAIGASAEAEELVARALGDPERPVVMFAFEWCEFCWSVRKLFDRCKIPFRSIDIDAVEYQAGDRGGKIRAAVTARTGSVTIPQIFVGRTFVGGATEVFDAFKEGRLQRLLADHHVAFDESVRLDPYGLLPSWLEPRRATSGASSR